MDYRNKEILSDIITQKSYDLPKTSTLLPPLANKIICIKDFQEYSKMHQTFWIKGKLQLKNATQPLWYMACDTCSGISYAEFNEVHLCNYCKYDHARAIPRGKCNAQLKTKLVLSLHL